MYYDDGAHDHDVAPNLCFLLLDRYGMHIPRFAIVQLHCPFYISQKRSYTRTAFTITMNSSPLGTRLRQAMRRSDVSAVRILLQRGAAVERYYLDQAALMGNADMVQVLLEHDAFDTQDRQSCLLNAICTSQNIAVVHELLMTATPAATSVNPNFCTHEKDTPLHLAVLSTTGTEILELLLQRGANPDATDSNGASPLHLVDHDHTQARVLCQYGADTTLRDKQGLTPLHKACRAGHLAVVQALCGEGGADPNATTAPGGEDSTTTTSSTPLSLAIRHHHGDIVEYLVESAFANPRPRSGEPPLMEALMQDDGSLLPSRMVRLGMDPFQKNSAGDTVLHVALQYISSENDNQDEQRMGTLSNCEYRLQFIDELLDCTPSLIHTRDASGRTALHVAAETGKAVVIPLFHKHGADLVARDQQARTPLHRAVTQGQESIVKCLLPLMQNSIDTRDGQGWTCLHWAVILQQNGIIRQLLRHGANVGACNAFGKSALHLVGFPLDQHRPPDSYSDLDIRRVLEIGNFAAHNNTTEQSCVGSTLVDRGAIALVTDQDENLPWFLAARSGQIGETMAMLRAAASQGLFERMSRPKRKIADQDSPERKRTRPVQND